MAIARLCLTFPRKLISTLESSQASFHYSIFTFLAMITVRNFIECFSQQGINYFDLNPTLFLIDQLHYYLFYISIAITLIGIYHIVTREPVVRIARVLLPSFIVLWLAPLIDLITTLGTGHTMQYFAASSGSPPFFSLLELGGNYEGATRGIRFEIIVILFLSCCYFLLKGRTLFISLFYTAMIYSVIFIYCASPILLSSLLMHLGWVYSFSSLLMIRFFSSLIFITGLGLFYYVNPKIFSTLWRDLPWLRISHYLLMLILGMTIGITQQTEPLTRLITQSNPTALIQLWFGSISLIFAALFSLVCNNIIDQPIDKLSNPHRALVKAALPESLYCQIGNYSGLLSLAFGLLAGFKLLFIMGFIMASYYLYSMPPIRLKRVPLLSKLVISTNSLALIIGGYLLVAHTMGQFPKALWPIFLIGFTLAANFIDIKDHVGDKMAGIHTLPGLLGLASSKRCISLAFVFTYLSFYFLMPSFTWLLVVLLAGGMMQVYLLNRRPYQEQSVLRFHLLSIGGLIILLLVCK